MFRTLKGIVVGLLLGFLASLVTLGLYASARAPAPRLPDPPALVERIREVARLETLDIAVYKKVTYEPAPEPSTSFFGEVMTWASYSMSPPRGKAIVFADVHLGLDLSRIDADAIRVDGDSVEIVLPPIVTTVALKPGETEIVRSNLEPKDMMQLLETARWAIEADVTADVALHDRARDSARRALRALLTSCGYVNVTFVEPGAPAS